MRMGVLLGPVLSRQDIHQTVKVQACIMHCVLTSCCSDYERHRVCSMTVPMTGRAGVCKILGLPGAVCCRHAAMGPRLIRHAEYGQGVGLLADPTVRMLGSTSWALFTSATYAVLQSCIIVFLFFFMQ